MSTEKSENELKKEAGALIAKTGKNLERLIKSLGEGYRVGGQDSLAQLKVQLEQFERWQNDANINASMYTEALDKLYKTINRAIQNPEFKESQSFSARLSRRATTMLQRQQKVMGQVSKQESEAKEVESEQAAKVGEQAAKQESEANEVESEQVAQVDDSDDDVIILPREKEDSVEQEEESDEDVVFLDPKTGEELKAKNNDQTSGQETNIQENDVEEEQFESESETDNEMLNKLAAIKETMPKIEVVMRGENGPHNDESEQTEEENVEVLRERLKAVQDGQSRNEALMAGVENIDELEEMTKKMGEAQGLKAQLDETEPGVEQKEDETEGVTNTTGVREEAKSDKGKEEIGSGQTVEIQSPSETVTKSNVTQSFVSIIKKADNIVTAGARVQDQIAELRSDINVIKNQPEFQQYQKELAQERRENMQNALKENFPTTYKEPKQTEINTSQPKLDSDQKAAYKAISKLDTLLERVEKSKIGIVKSILKGQVRKHLEAMNANPLKDSIQKVGGLKTEKTQEADVRPQSFKK
ncbi:MAG: hypothetical protein K2X50_07830 [Gammaproteobacteria bacterium]|nr:hypothetical protein [Gammaproteobacteria bacterium]